MTIDHIQFGPMPCKWTTDAVYILKRTQVEYEQRNFYTRLVDLEKVFDVVTRKIDAWAMWKKGIPEVLVWAEMSLYIGTMRKVKDGTHICKELKANVGVHQGSVLSQLLFAFMIDFVPRDIKEGTLQKNIVRWWCRYDCGKNCRNECKTLWLEEYIYINVLKDNSGIIVVLFKSLVLSLCCEFRLFCWFEL